MNKKRTGGSLLKAAIVTSFIATAMPVMAEGVDINSAIDANNSLLSSNTGTIYEYINGTIKPENKTFTMTEDITLTQNLGNLVVDELIIEGSSVIGDTIDQNGNNSSAGGAITNGGIIDTPNPDFTDSDNAGGNIDNLNPPVGGAITNGGIIDTPNPDFTDSGNAGGNIDNLNPPVGGGDIVFGDTITKTYSINGKGYSGITVNDGQKLTIQNVGKVLENSETGEITVLNSVNNFSNFSSDGIIFNKGVVAVNDSVFYNNKAKSGSIINNRTTVDVISGSFFINNNTNNCGGVIYNYYGSVNLIDNSSFISNSSEYGGVIYNYSGIYKNIVNSTFENNMSSVSGGAIYNGKTITSISNSTFKNNISLKFGGAIRNNKTINEIKNSIFKDNIAAEEGGAIYNSGYLGIYSDGGKTEFSGNMVGTEESAFVSNAIYNDDGQVILGAQNNTDLILFNDKITGEGSATLNINQTQTVDGVTTDYNGTVIFNDTVTGNTVNLYNGTLQLGSMADPNVEGSVNIKAPTVENLNIMSSDATLSLMNGVFDNGEDGTNVVQISSIADTANIAIDVDFVNNQNDKISYTGDNAIKITGLNIINDMTGVSDTIKISDTAVKSVASSVYTTDFKYKFAESTTGVIDVTKGLSNGLYEAVKDASDVVTYNLTANESIIDDLGEIASKEMSIIGDGNYSINGNGHTGLVVNNGTTLTIKDIGSLDPDGNVVNSINGFTSTNGGAVNVLENATLNITNSVFNGNEADNGGGIYNYGTANISDATFQNNTADSSGGAIYNRNTLTIDGGATFTGNTADSNGGAIFNYKGTVEIADGATFESNYASENGGAIRNNANGVITINGGATFTNNTADYYGGAISNRSATITINTANDSSTLGNVLFSGNTANGVSNAIHNTNGTVNLNAFEGHNITFNDAITGSNGTLNLNQSATADGTVTDYKGTVIFNKNVTGSEVNLYNGTLQLGSKAVDENSSNIKAPTVENLNIRGNNATLSLMNGDMTDNVTIKSISDIANIAIDVDFTNDLNDKISYTGDKAIKITGLNIINDMTDGTNTDTITISDSAVKSVASAVYKTDYKYKFAESTTGTINVSKSLANGLYEAVQDDSEVVTYNLTANDTIVDDLGTMQSTEMSIIGDGQYSINGNGHTGLTVGDGTTLTIKDVGSLDADGNVVNSINGFVKNGSDGGFAEVKSGGKLVLENVVLSGNSSALNSDTYAGGSGGAIYNYGTVEMTDSAFTNNSATATYDSAYGGAIYNSGSNSKLTITDSDFTNNSATAESEYEAYAYGGAIYNYGTVEINNSDFTNNSATAESEYVAYAYGGAIYNSGTITITDSDFKNNSATAEGGYVASAYGGAIYNNSATVEINNSDFTKNSATAEGEYPSAYGGAIYNGWGTVEINNSDFTNNSATAEGEYPSASGGAIYNNGKLTITDANFTNNYATGAYEAYGGAISNYGTVEITDSDFKNNSATAEHVYGGAIYNTGSNSKLTITDSDFTNNSATSSYDSAYGGAIFNYNGTVTINALNDNVLFSGNTDSSGSNAIHNEAGTVNLNAFDGHNITFDDAITGSSGTLNLNQSATVDGVTTDYIGTVIFNDSVTGNTINLYNGTLQLGSKAPDENSSNIAAPTVENLNIMSSDATLSLMNGVFDNGENDTNVVQISSIADTANIAIDVDFTNNLNDKISYSGDKKSVKITGLNVINDIPEVAGTDNITISDSTNLKIVSSSVYNTDYKYKFAASSNATTTVTKGLANGLYEAVQDTSEVVTYNLTANDTIIDNLGEIASKEMSIIGDGQYSINGNGHKGLTVNSGKTLTIQNVGSIERDENGKPVLDNEGNIRVINSINGFKNDTKNGVFIINNSGSITNSDEGDSLTYGLIIDNTVIADNSAQNGVIYNNNVANIDNSVIADNSAKNGVIYNNNVANINNSTFVNNSANKSAGVIFNSSTGNMVVTNSAFFENETVDFGGAIYNYKGILELADSDFSGNKSTIGNAGAIYNSGTLDINNLKFTENSANKFGGAIYNKRELNLSGTNTFENNLANVVIEDGVVTSSDKNDIYNAGTVNISGTTTFDGGISGDGTLNIQENATVILKDGVLEQKVINLANNSLIDVDNEKTDSLTKLAVSAGATANLAIDFNDKVEGTAGEDSILQLKSIDLAGVAVNSENVVSTTLAQNIVLNSDTEILNKSEEINYFTYFQKDDEFKLTAKNATLDDVIADTNNINDALYELAADETISVGSTVSGDNNAQLNIVGAGSSVTDGSIIVENNATLEVADVNIKNSVTEGNDAAKAAITVQAGGEVNLIAKDHDIAIINTDNNVALFLEGNEDKTSTANLVAKDGKKITINEDILSDNKANVVNFNGGHIEFNGLFDPVAANVNSGTLVRNGYDDDISWNLNGGTLKYTNDKYIYNSEHHNGTTYQLNDINFNGGALDLMNFGVNTVKLDALTISKNSNLYVDADLEKGTMDKLTANSIEVIEDAKLNVAGINLVSDTFKPETSINFTEDEKLKGVVQYTGKQGVKTAYSPIYKYDVAYDSATGNFNFKKNPHEFNPVVNTAPVAQQMAFLNQLNSYDEAFANMDMIMLMPRYERIALKNKNKYAYGDFNYDLNQLQSLEQGLEQDRIHRQEQEPLEANVLVAYNENIIPEETNGAWFKPFVTMEKVNLDNGPRVDNTAYGGLVGTDSGILELRNGWDAVYSLYAGYNGSMQDFQNVSITQNGGMLGATSVFYKGNFFTGLTANVGASQANASTAYGNEDFTMLTTGVASKTGYNFEFFNGKFIMQPSWLMSYSFVNTFNYKNSAGLSIESDALNAMQFAPALKLIGNFKNGWQPYANFQMVWNVMDKTDFTANDVSLPDLSVDPYMQYTIGVQKRWGERCTGSLQTTLRHGGRDGISFSANFRYALGDESNKSASRNRIQTIEDRRVINLSANRM